MERYNFNIEQIRIVEVDFKVKQQEEGGEIEVNPSINFDFSYEGNFLDVILGISFDSKSSPFHFNVSGLGRFKFNSNIEDTFGDKINKVALINCCSIIFPFIRETIAELTRKAGFTPMLLPPVNFVNIYQESNKLENKDISKENCQ